MHKAKQPEQPARIPFAEAGTANAKLKFGVRGIFKKISRKDPKPAKSLILDQVSGAAFYDRIVRLFPSQSVQDEMFAAGRLCMRPFLERMGEVLAKQIRLEKPLDFGAKLTD
ncbi:MAG: hypothetical protein N3D11_03245 [Candidatus Sumerlaeia bacterium]|nr:hypothetical protein [Candidatus Sumerlaeia bacterium]